MGKKTRTSFKPGRSGNPAGRPQIPSDIKAARFLNQIELERILNHCVFLSVTDVTRLSKAKDAPAALVGAASIVAKMAKGDLWSYAFVVDRLIGRVREQEPRDVTPPVSLTAGVKKTFTEFCVTAGYPAPFPKQIEMMDFGLNQTDPRLLLGARNYGKTDYITILGVAYKVYLIGSTYSCVIITKEKKRGSAIIAEIAAALKANGVELEKENGSCIRVEGRLGKDHSVESVSIKQSFRGRHPQEMLMDDPVTEEDVSPAMRDLVQRKYNEALKLCSNVLVIGQPAHAHDLYAKLRGLIKKLEVPHGTIPELDHDLDAQRLAGVDEKSIQASYFLKIISDGTAPFEKINYLDRYPVGDSVAFLDPSHKGKDLSALSIVRQHFQGVAVVGFAAHRAWNHWAEEVVANLKKFGVKKLCIECNGLGDQPVLLFRSLLKDQGIGVVGMDSTDNKHARIMAAGTFAHLIHLSKESDAAYTKGVVQYEYGAEFDDPPDSLATCLKWIGLIRGKA